jgi:hypothetical protein
MRQKNNIQSEKSCLLFDNVAGLVQNHNIDVVRFVQTIVFEHL